MIYPEQKWIFSSLKPWLRVFKYYYLHLLSTKWKINTHSFPKYQKNNLQCFLKIFPLNNRKTVLFYRLIISLILIMIIYWVHLLCNNQLLKSQNRNCWMLNQKICLIKISKYSFYIYSEPWFCVLLSYSSTLRSPRNLHSNRVVVV